jgi:hypothetical protein
MSCFASIFCANAPEVHVATQRPKGKESGGRRATTIRIAVPAMTGPLAIPLSTAEKSVFALENCRVGFGNLIVISPLSPFWPCPDSGNRAPFSAGWQRTGRGTQPHAQPC